MMDIIIDFDDDDPKGYRTIEWDDQPSEPIADRMSEVDGDDREEQEQVPAATLADKPWRQILDELFISFFHEDKNEFLKLRTLDLNPQHQYLLDHVAVCDECRAAVESAEAKRKARR